MFHLIGKIRQMPIHKRKWIAFSIAFSFCLILFLLWISVWFPKSHISFELQNKEFVKPADSLASNIFSLWEDAEVKFSNLKNTIKNINFVGESNYVQEETSKN